jgi:hypothetical protein
LINDIDVKNNKITIKVISKPDIKEILIQDENQPINKKYKAMFLSKFNED